MKNQINQLFLLLSLVISTHILTAMDVYEAPTRTYTPKQYQNLTNAIHTTLLNDSQFQNNMSSKDFVPGTSNKLLVTSPNDYNQSRSLSRNSSTKNIDNSGIYYLPTEADIMNSTTPADHDSISLSSYIPAPLPNDTPTAYLRRTMESSVNFGDAFDTLTQSMNSAKKGSSEYVISQQARTLLARTHPELVQGLSANLAILPNRFMSYFKENLPTLSTDAGKKRFVQSIVMETLKSMPSDNAMTKLLIKENPSAYYNENQEVSFAYRLDKFNKTFDNQLTSITAKYTNNLSAILENNDLPTQATLITQWSRNIITELALLAPRAIGATVGAAGGAVAGAAMGVAAGAIAGADAGFNLVNKIGGKTDAALGNIAGGGAGAAIGIGIGAPLGAVGGTIVGAQEGTQLGESLARSASNAVGQGARYVASTVGQAASKAYNSAKQSLTSSSTGGSSGGMQFSNFMDEDVSNNNSVDSNAIMAA